MDKKVFDSNIVSIVSWEQEIRHSRICSETIFEIKQFKEKQTNLSNSYFVSHSVECMVEHRVF